jgi:hypothetical protein
MAKKRATKKKATKKTAPKPPPEWEANPPIPDLPTGCDLSRQAGCSRLRNYALAWNDTNQAGRTGKIPSGFEPHRYHSDVGRFAEVFQPSPLTHRENSLLMSGDNLYMLRNKVLKWYFHADSVLIAKVDVHSTKGVAERSPLAVLLTGVKKRSKDTKNHSHLWLVNADQENNGNLNDGDDDSAGMAIFPSVSFNCLLQFYGNKGGLNALADRLAKREIHVVDWTPSETRELTARQKDQIKKNCQSKKKTTIKPPEMGFQLVCQSKKKTTIKPPEMGFQLVGNAKWHRSGSVLFEDTKSKAFMLLGIDEGSYFGCELPCKASSIDEAYRALTPEHLASRSDVERQGEWYLVPVDKKDVPDKKDCTLLFEVDHPCIRRIWRNRNHSEVYLPMENDQSNQHFINTRDGRVGQNGAVYVLDPCLSHDDHEELDVKGWRVFEKNLAVRSFSQDGVD